MTAEIRPQEPVNDGEIIVQRLVDAPRALVFKAWTDPAHVANWFAPRAMTITVQQMDVRPGGRFHFTWHNADGTDMPVKGAYREVVAPERLVYTDEWEAPGIPAQEAVVTVTFAEQQGKTLLTVRTLFSSAEIRNGAIEQGFEMGWAEIFDRLVEEVAKQRA